MTLQQIYDLAIKLGIESDVKIGTTGVFNEGSLRFKNEPVRHKLLDMLGGLALIGAPIKAQILADSPSLKEHREAFEIGNLPATTIGSFYHIGIGLFRYQRRATYNVIL